MGNMLDRFIADAVKAKDFWGENGALDMERARLNQIEAWYEKDRRNRSREMMEALSQASGTYCAAAMDSMYHSNLFRLHEPKKWRWKIRTCWYLIVARWLSHKALELAGGNGNMTADQLSRRADVLYSCRRYDAAGDCLETALSRNGLPPNTQIGLLVQMAKVAWRQTGEVPEQVFVDVERIILGCEVSPRVIVHFLRTKAKILERAGGASYLINQTAIRVAQISVRHNLPEEVGDWDHRARV